MGPLVGMFSAPSPVMDYAGARASADRGWYPAFMHGLLERGVAVAPGAYEVLFPSLAHSDADLDIVRDTKGAPWLLDLIYAAAERGGGGF